MTPDLETIPLAPWLEAAGAELRVHLQRGSLDGSAYCAAQLILAGVEDESLPKPEVCIVHRDGIPSPRIIWRGPTGVTLLIQPFCRAGAPWAHVTVFDAEGVYATVCAKAPYDAIRRGLEQVFPRC